MLVTVFTPTYDRGYIIKTLYESLIRQSSTKFEWIVVDDGSTDNTEDLFNNFINEGKIAITYLKTINGGKQRAINRGVTMAKGDLFFIVDSDDYLADNAIYNILKEWEVVEDKEDIAGLCFRKVNYNSGNIIGGQSVVDNGDFNSMEIHYKLGISGDKAEVFKTSIIKLFPFPEFESENFVPEALIWNRIAAQYKLRFVNIGIYMCEYLPDGLSNNFTMNLRKNSKGFAAYYREVLFYKQIPFLIKLKSLIRYFQCLVYNFKKTI